MRRMVEYPEEWYDEWYAQGCPRNESGEPILLGEACDYCPYQYGEECGYRWEHCPLRGRDEERGRDGSKG
ncbi:MAG: hypothetical protein DRP27_05300 [Thermotogae bacterium]|nr:MAG: hypothetical protein DRP27_05300 [Thermotogota bacterium]